MVFMKLREVRNGGVHAARVRVIGIHNDLIVFRMDDLGTVVRGYIGFDPLDDLFHAHVKIPADGNGRQDIVGIIVANKLRLNGMSPVIT